MAILSHDVALRWSVTAPSGAKTRRITSESASAGTSGSTRTDGLW